MKVQKCFVFCLFFHLCAVAQSGEFATEQPRDSDLVKEINRELLRATAELRVQNLRQKFVEHSILNAGLTRLNVVVANEFAILSPVGVGTFAQIPDEMGFDILSRSVTQTLRDIARDTPFASYVTSVGEGFSEAILSTVSSVDEQESRLLQVAPLPSEVRWRQSVRDRGLTYGVRPFSRYVFVAGKIPIGGGYEPIIANLRYHLDSVDKHRVVVSLSLPLSEGWSLDTGFEGRIGFGSVSGIQSGERCVGIVRLMRATPRGVFFAGINSNDAFTFANVGYQCRL